MTTAMSKPTTATSTASAPSTTVAEQLRQSPGVKAAIQSIIGELKAKQSQITEVRGPREPKLKQSFDEFMKRAADVRGRPLLYPYIGSGIGNGPFVELVDGSVKLDMLTGIGVHFFGHSDPDLVSVAIEAATSDLVMQGHLILNDDAILFNEQLVKLASRKSRLKHAFLCNSGAMANEHALKVCFQKHSPASRVIAFKDCFMGRSWAMAQIGDSAAGRQGLPLNVLVDYMPFYDHVAARRFTAGDISGPTRYIDMAVWHLRQYIERYPGQHACFIFELVQGEGGFNTALPEFHRELMQVCKDAGIAVWADEIQTFGRTNELFCFEALGLGDMIDVCCIGKMSQVCATMYTEQYNPKPGLLSGTFLGSTDAIRVGRRVLERLSSGSYYGDNGSIARHHKLFTEQVRALARKNPEWFPAVSTVPDIVGGYGGMMRFTPFGGDKDTILKLCKIMFDEGMIAFHCGHGPYHVRMLPPLGVLDESIWPVAFGIIERAMARTASETAKK
ncbi:MAG TPA: aminotransferase class III-fold pyridoxal phosphate-dependent enzyme [Phycisphaerales bacterium]|nr:aminotransferase class III-fold pyridoxal phosphate-dependent enzyme [Phycisphaerales bacterium]